MEEPLLMFALGLAFLSSAPAHADDDLVELKPAEDQEEAFELEEAKPEPEGRKTKTKGKLRRIALVCGHYVANAADRALVVALAGGLLTVATLFFTFVLRMCGVPV
jgi:hypothetical protein